ncbi:MAG: hypothetical protein J1G05_04720 [Clostridiales bacterium]|nr:hypothetical protein [Clostridiales bacterium]
MIYSEKSLGQILRDMYDNAPNNERVLMIHLFGIKYGDIIVNRNFKIANIIQESGLYESYNREVSKGINLGKYVQIKPEKDIF